MSIIGKCPGCEKSITEIKAVAAPAKDNGRSLNGAVYTCPYCSTILGAGLDPLATVEETVDQVVRKLRGI